MSQRLAGGKAVRTSSGNRSCRLRGRIRVAWQRWPASCESLLAWEGVATRRLTGDSAGQHGPDSIDGQPEIRESDCLPALLREARLRPAAERLAKTGLGTHGVALGALREAAGGAPTPRAKSSIRQPRPQSGTASAARTLSRARPGNFEARFVGLRRSPASA